MQVTDILRSLEVYPFVFLFLPFIVFLWLPILHGNVPVVKHLRRFLLVEPLLPSLLELLVKSTFVVVLKTGFNERETGKTVDRLGHGAGKYDDFMLLQHFP